MSILVTALYGCRPWEAEDEVAVDTIPHSSFTNCPDDAMVLLPTHPGRSWGSSIHRARNRRTGECITCHLVFPQFSWQPHFCSKCEYGKEINREKSWPYWWILHFYSLKSLFPVHAKQQSLHPFLSVPGTVRSSLKAACGLKHPLTGRVLSSAVCGGQPLVLVAAQHVKYS